MPSSRTRRQSARLARNTAELSWAAPQVVAHRMARMASAGWSPSAADRREFALMGAEKVAAFAESWQAMGVAVWQTQQRLWMDWAMQCAQPWWLQGWSGGLQKSGHHLQQGMLDVLGEGLRPVHRRAVSNARRLGGRR